MGMTGDGVNDAPALKKADAGIAVSGATDAARSAADIVLLSPGLSVIIHAIQESRKIFQRMQSYAIYRIAETIRVLLFMTLSILVFNFYPVTAVMIVLLALLNDGAILSIAYDRVRYSNQPEVWNMRIVLGDRFDPGSGGRFRLVRPVLPGRAGVQAQPGSHSILDVPQALRRRTPDHFRHQNTRSLLVHSTGGHSVLGRARHANRRHADRRLWVVHGSAGLVLGLFVWVYALAWFLFNDRVKLELTRYSIHMKAV